MFDDLTEQLEALIPSKRAAIIKRWRRIVAPELRALSRQIDPFRGKVRPKQKSAFGVAPDRRDKKAVSIWGVHPNIAADPTYSIPPEGFRKVEPFAVKTPRGWVMLDKAQAHWRKRDFIRPYWNTSYLEWHFTIRGRAYGTLAGTKHVIPVYSTRSVPDMLMDHPELEEIIRRTFGQAVKEELS